MSYTLSYSGITGHAKGGAEESLGRAGWERAGSAAPVRQYQVQCLKRSSKWHWVGGKHDSVGQAHGDAERRQEGLLGAPPSTVA